MLYWRAVYRTQSRTALRSRDWSPGGCMLCDGQCINDTCMTVGSARHPACRCTGARHALCTRMLDEGVFGAHWRSTLLFLLHNRVHSACMLWRQDLAVPARFACMAAGRQLWQLIVCARALPTNHGFSVSLQCHIFRRPTLSIALSSSAAGRNNPAFVSKRKVLSSPECPKRL